MPLRGPATHIAEEHFLTIIFTNKSEKLTAFCVLQNMPHANSKSKWENYGTDFLEVDWYMDGAPVEFM